MGKKNKIKKSESITSAKLLKSKFAILNQIVEDVYLQHVKLNEEETKALVERFQKVTHTFVEIMKEVDPTFKEIYSKTIGTGSFYDGLRITEATEFDLNLVLKPNLRMSLVKKRRPAGFMSIRVAGSLNKMAYNDWIIREDFLNPNAVRWWFQGVVEKALKKLGDGTSIHGCKLKAKESGPARTLTITSEEHPRKTIDIDLVPVLEFPITEAVIAHMPPVLRKKARNLGLNEPWFAVPKPPANNCPCLQCISWRMSFPLQETAILENQHFLKYTLRLIKKLRDTLEINELASYYIKSLFLFELLKNGPEQWEQSSRGYLFIHMLDCLIKALDDGRIIFVWHQNCNLLEKVNRESLKNRVGQLKKYRNEIEVLISYDKESLKRKIEKLLI